MPQPVSCLTMCAIESVHSVSPIELVYLVLGKLGHNQSGCDYITHRVVNGSPVQLLSRSVIQESGKVV